MKKLNAKGFRASKADKKALSHYLLETPKDWANSALKGMINKAIKTIMRDYFDLYKSKQTANIPADLSVIIPNIISMEEFKPYNIQTPETPIVDRKESKSDEIWENGFDIEDYEEAALRAFYEDPEAMLEYFMENKIHARRKAFVKEHEKDFFKNKESIPAKQDNFINHVHSKPGYLNRKQREALNDL